MSVAFQEYIPSSSDYRQKAAFLCSQAARLGTLGGAVTLVAKAFFGGDWLYPATITGICFCAWAGSGLAGTPHQELFNREFGSKILSFFPKCIRKYLDHWEEFKRWKPVSNDHTLPRGGILDTLLKILTPPPKESVEVRAFTNGVWLKYETRNLQTKVKSSGNIHSNCPLKEMIELLKTCSVALEDNGVPVFSQSYLTLSGADGSIVELLLRKRDLIWNIYDRKVNRVISTQRYSLSFRCSTDTKDFFKDAEKRSLIEQIRLARECVLYDYDSSSVCLEPIHQTSFFNKDVLISKFMWAVTLIRFQGPSGNHAEIIVEGINDGFVPEQIVPIGKYFMYLADLIGEKEIVVNGSKRRVRAIRTRVKNKEFRLKFEARSTNWKRSAKLVKNMILDIEREKENPPPGFAKYGRHSIFASTKVVEDSCITWALDQLSKINIVLEKTSHSYLFTNTSLYTNFRPEQVDPKFNTILFIFADESKLI